MIWKVEDKKISKDIDKLPRHIQKHYSLWKRTVTELGIVKLREIKSYHFEKLQGKRQGQLSCRLSQDYRVIFEIYSNVVSIVVLEVNKHEY
jgi:plasmid maintenance system killer protein